MIALEEGPAAIFDRVRARAGAYDYGENGMALTSLGRGISCPLCVGVYVAALMLLLVAKPTRAGDLFLGWIGVSSAQAFLMKVEE